MKSRANSSSDGIFADHTCRRFSPPRERGERDAVCERSRRARRSGWRASSRTGGGTCCWRERIGGRSCSVRVTRVGVGARAHHPARGGEADLAAVHVAIEGGTNGFDPAANVEQLIGPTRGCQIGEPIGEGPNSRSSTAWDAAHA
jgi:hypothetical protein